MSECRRRDPHLARGLSIPIFFTKENAEATMDMIPEEGDIVIASFPKTGSTLCMYIVLQVLSKGESFPPKDEVASKVAPLLDMMGPGVLETQQKPRVYKFHLPYHTVRKNGKAKYLYTYRHPEDTLLSFYHFFNGITCKVHDFDEFFEDFVSGKVWYGSYFEHLMSIFMHRNDPNILLISYEELVRNRKNGILRIAKFLGEQYYQNLLDNETLLEKIVERTSFDYMKKHLSYTLPQLVMQGKTASHASDKVNFFRKGVIGDGKNVLSAKQLQRLRNYALEAVKDTDLVEEWYTE